MYNLKHDDDYFLSVLDELVKEHNGEFVLIHNREIIGFFVKRDDAINKAISIYPYGEYLVTQVVSQKESPKFISFRYQVL